MKRKYIKPGIYVENFALSQTIAAGGCEAALDSSLGIPGYGSKGVCGWDIGGVIIWNVGATENCNLPPADDNRGLCYNNPDGGAVIFGLS